ncbi:MAG: hypothetical protein OJJ54_04150 [Pseudonocardia sp.]|nr:hypothetical protein [Pseudonocardia sp.]
MSPFLRDVDDHFSAENVDRGCRLGACGADLYPLADHSAHQAWAI